MWDLTKILLNCFSCGRLKKWTNRSKHKSIKKNPKKKYVFQASVGFNVWHPLTKHTPRQHYIEIHCSRKIKTLWPRFAYNA
jgi:hypothetical protein